MVSIDNLLWNVYYKGKLIGESIPTEDRHSVIEDMLTKEELDEAADKGELEFKLVSFGEE